MNEARPSANLLRDALLRVEAGEFEELERAAVEADAIGREAVKAALAVEVRLEPARLDIEAERQRVLDAALADASNVMERHRARLGRRVTSRHDATTMRQIYELLRAMAGADGGADNDPSFM